MIIGVAAGSVFANMTYQANYYFLADLNMDVSSIKQMDDASMVNYTCIFLESGSSRYCCCPFLQGFLSWKR